MNMLGLCVHRTALERVLHIDLGDCFARVILRCVVQRPGLHEPKHCVASKGELMMLLGRRSSGYSLFGKDQGLPFSPLCWILGELRRLEMDSGFADCFPQARVKRLCSPCCTRTTSCLIRFEVAPLMGQDIGTAWWCIHPRLVWHKSLE
jgi:hypothetical protein